MGGGGRVWSKFNNFRQALGVDLKFYTSVERIKTKSQKVLGANLYLCKSYSGKTGEKGRVGEGGRFLPPPILNSLSNLLSIPIEHASPHRQRDV